MAKKKDEWKGYKTVYFTRMHQHAHSSPNGERGYSAAQRRKNKIAKTDHEDYDNKN